MGKVVAQAPPNTPIQSPTWLGTGLLGQGQKGRGPRGRQGHLAGTSPVWLAGWKEHTQKRGGGWWLGSGRPQDSPQSPTPTPGIRVQLNTLMFQPIFGPWPPCTPQPPKPTDNYGSPCQEGGPALVAGPVGPALVAGPVGPPWWSARGPGWFPPPPGPVSALTNSLCPLPRGRDSPPD